MARRIETLLDDVGWRLLVALQENARVSFSALGRKVGLSAPAVAERVRRMEETGIIAGYQTRLGLERLGRPIAALIRVSTPEEHSGRVKALARELTEVLECHHLTGSDSFIVKVAVSSVAHLEAVIESFGRYGTPTTAIILSSPVAGRTIGGPPVPKLARRGNGASRSQGARRS